VQELRGEVAERRDAVEAPAAQGRAGQPGPALHLRRHPGHRDPGVHRPLQHRRLRLYPFGWQVDEQVHRVGGAVGAPAQRVQDEVRLGLRVVRRRHGHRVALDAVRARGQAGAERGDADRGRGREARGEPARVRGGGELGQRGGVVRVRREQFGAQPVDQQHPRGRDVPAVAGDPEGVDEPVDVQRRRGRRQHLGEGAVAVGREERLVGRLPPALRRHGARS
jgi:hypothetical protein